MRNWVRDCQIFDDGRVIYKARGPLGQARVEGHRDQFLTLRNHALQLAGLPLID